ncbi:MAG: radical SAM protein [Gaiellales bacterium]
MIIRDLDVLAAAAQRTRVRCNFSIGTVDDDVWRASEPGTPPPRQRIEAVRRLNEAGIPCGVLVAPILPGISDDEDRLEAVVEAVLAAGAVSITPIFLHLRPGVREVFMPWLAEYRPDLVHRYRKLYASSYATAAGARTTQLVEELVSKHGGVPVAAAGTRLAA